MKKAIMFPGKYMQGEHILNEIGSVVANYKKSHVFLIWGGSAKTLTCAEVLSSLENAGIKVSEEIFAGEITRAKADVMTKACIANGCDIVVGVGGGKIQDIAKAVAAAAELRVVLCPTVSASDASTGGCTVWYKEDGCGDGVGRWPNNPDAIIVDTAVCVKAPVRMFRAGVADALATYIEADACNDTHAKANSGGAPTLTALALGKLCYDTLLKYAPAAELAVEAKLSTPIYERVIEATTLMSGIGWESGGVCTAHVLGNFLGAFPETHGFMHGEKVAFGIAVQLMLDPDLDVDFINEVYDFMIRMKLPVTMSDVKMQDVSRERIYALAVERCNAKIMLERHNFKVEPEALCNAFFMAKAYGKKRRELLGL